MFQSVLRCLYKLKLLSFRLPSSQRHLLQPFGRVIAFPSLSVHMSIVSFDPDYAPRMCEMRSGRIAIHKRSAFVAPKAKWDQSKFAFSLSTSFVDFRDLSSRKKPLKGC